MKLHPLSIPYRAARAVGNVVVIVFFAFFGIPQFLDGALAYAVAGLVVIVGLLAILGWQYAYYRRYEYELTENTLDIDAGVLSRRSREIPYGRVQNVSIERTVVQRALGLAEVRVETAGGSGTEAHLQYVGKAEADRLQNEISERKRRSVAAERDGEAIEGEATAGEATPAERRELLFEMTPRELGVLGIVSLDSRILPLVFFAITPFVPQIRDLAGGSAGLAVLFVPAIVLAIYLATAVLSAAYAVTNYYGFQLFEVGDELRYERGLLQKFSGTIPLAKVQAVTITENVLARLVGYASLTAETAGFSPGQEGGSQAAVPIARRDRVVELAKEIEPVDLPAFERPPKRARTRYVARYSIVLGVLTAIAYGAVAGDVWGGPWWIVPLAFPLVPIAAHLKWRNLGYALTDDHVLTRHGFWSRTTKIVPYHRVQTVADSQTVFQRRRGLATVHVDIAGSQSLVSDDSRMVDVDRAVADELRETIAERLLDALAEQDERPADRFRDGPVDPAGIVQQSSASGEESATGSERPE
ncbi:PH domain-containing protein [Salinarchaeum chitinilyticum]